MAEYTTLTNGDLQAIYRDALRGKESDHARRAALPEDYRGSHIKALERQITRLRELVVEADALAAADAAEIAPPVAVAADEPIPADEVPGDPEPTP